MNRILTILSVGVLSIAFSSCGGGAKKPEDVAEAFIKAVNKEDFATAKQHATKKTGNMLDMMKGMIENMDEEQKGEKGEFKELKDTEVKEDKATVTYCCDKNGEDDEVKLKKVDGEWKVHIDKEQPGGSGGGGS